MLVCDYLQEIEGGAWVATPAGAGTVPIDKPARANFAREIQVNRSHSFARRLARRLGEPGQRSPKAM